MTERRNVLNHCSANDTAYSLLSDFSLKMLRIFSYPTLFLFLFINYLSCEGLIYVLTEFRFFPTIFISSNFLIFITELLAGIFISMEVRLETERATLGF